MLLRTIVDVAFKSPPLVILHGDDALARSTQLLCLRAQVKREAHIAEGGASLRGKIRQ